MTTASIKGQLEAEIPRNYHYFEVLLRKYARSGAPLNDVRKMMDIYIDQYPMLLEFCSPEKIGSILRTKNLPDYEVLELAEKLYVNHMDFMAYQVDLAPVLACVLFTDERIYTMTLESLIRLYCSSKRQVVNFLINTRYSDVMFSQPNTGIMIDWIFQPDTFPPGIVGAFVRWERFHVLWEYLPETLETDKELYRVYCKIKMESAKAFSEPYMIFENDDDDGGESIKRVVLFTFGGYHGGNCLVDELTLDGGYRQWEGRCRYTGEKTLKVWCSQKCKN